MSFPQTNSDKPFIDHVRMLNNYIFNWLRVNSGYLYLFCNSKWPPLLPFKHIVSYNFGGKYRINFILVGNSVFITLGWLIKMFITC